jgi:putative ABC transport system permease protein
MPVQVIVMDSVIRDLRYAMRSIAGSKRFAAIVIVTLALGIGANTAVFGVLNAVVLKPLPYDEPERLVRVYHSAGADNSYMTGLAALAYRQQSKTLDVAILYTYSAEGADLTDRPEPERVRAMQVSADYFRVFGVRPLLGQVFARADERANARVAVASERIWRKYLGGTADAAGRPLSINGVAYSVVGVVPDGFDDPLESGVEVWTPLNLQPGPPNTFDNYYLSAVARLRPGATLDQAQAELATLAAGMQASDAPAKNRWSTRVVPLQTDTVGNAGPMLWILLGAVGLLLIIACVNVASLFLARGAARETELAVRAALGCSGWRLVRQLLVESVLLSLTGGVVGLLLAKMISGTLLAAAPAAVTHVGSEALERSVLAFSFGVAVLAGIAFGVAPAIQATRPDLEMMLRESGRSSSGSRRQTRARNVLVVCQVALALVLLIGAGLLLRTFERLRSVDLGVRTSHVMTFAVNLPMGRYADAEQRARFHRDFQARLAALPGVRAAAAVSRLPVTGTYHSWGVRRADLPPEARGVQAQQRVVEGPYFKAVGIPLLRGRTFGPEDDAKAPRRVVISQELVRQLFPSEDPIGKQLRVAGGQPEIIGVVGDVALSPRAAIRPYVYHSHSQFAGDRNWALTQVVALDADPSTSLLADARRELSRIDPSLVLYEPKMLDDVIGAGVAQERFALLVVASFALLALVLAAVGIYGVLSYTVSRRTREMGIRMALGAPAASVRALIVRDGGRLAALGIVIGCVGAYAATRVLRSLLFEVSATEPLVFVSAASVLGLVAMAASWIPARAATRANPLEAVRD